jgi:hypothetical protein
MTRERKIAPFSSCVISLWELLLKCHTLNTVDLCVSRR